ncbi:MAG TPA: TonB-dependent receptor [Candidatus Angelobacter sp.]|nr:TonB-dependent receptor [Candidatus Angelobacter sp.]
MNNAALRREMFLTMVVCLLSSTALGAWNADCDAMGQISGVVQDQTEAVIVGARVSLVVRGKQRASAVTNAQGIFVFSCLIPGDYSLKATAKGFASRQIDVHLVESEQKKIEVALRIATQHSTITAVAPSPPPESSDPGSLTLNEQQLAALADDPDDFQRELQALAATSGGIPGQATVTVDGFSNASRLPPKSAIGEVRINPDLFSSEYENPPYQGGRIEVVTKPGQTKFHGAAFFSLSGLLLNARDPLAHTEGPINRERYGADLSGPLFTKKNDFSLHVEYRTVGENKAINAFALNPQTQIVPLAEDVGSVSSQWLSSARADWQLSAKDNLITSFSVHRNHSSNDGVGGMVLPEAGYQTSQEEYALRISNNDAINAKLLHQSRVGLTWKNLDQVPNSTAPALIVEGAFSGGGAASQFQRRSEQDLELGDNLLLTHKAHSLKVGAVAVGRRIDDRSSELFNGLFDFGGGFGPALDAAGNPIPGTSQFLSGLEQYRRTLVGLAGGKPTNFVVNNGDPHVQFTQWRVAAFVQDEWKVSHRVALSSGLRYAMESTPSSLGTFAPRLGLAWSPWPKPWLILRARAGLFYQPIDESVVLRERQLDGTTTLQTILYAPEFAALPDPSTAVALVRNLRRFADDAGPSRTVETQIGLDANLPAHWKLEASGYWTWAHHVLRSVNVNSPILADVTSNPFTAPRPITPGINVFEYQSSGLLEGPVIFVGINQFSSKRYSLLIGYLNFGMTTNADNSTTFPQSAFSSRGEMARPSWEARQRVFSTAQLNLPWDVSLSSHLEAASGLPYNITTGFDNNGDGITNDRPSVAGPGDPLRILTTFGPLTPLTIEGNIPRNLGTMPATVHLDLSLSRRFALHPSVPENSRAITVVARVSNVINHTNVTAVNTILGSPAFTQPVTADAGRRIELGGRYSF